MNLKNKIAKHVIFIVAIGLAVTGCQKMERPALTNYPKDVNPVGGPLKFFAALDGSSVDSIRANFATDNNVTYVDGVNGKAAKFDTVKKGFIVYPGANDFASQTNFSVSLWINAGTIAQKDHVNADGIFAFAKTSDFWGNFTLFVDHETSTADSMRLTLVLGGVSHDSTASNVSTFISHDNANRIPHMYDGNWHHFVFTVNSATSAFSFYLDGKIYEQKTLTNNVSFKDATVLVLGGFQQAASVQGDYTGNTWMSPFPGAIDQVRLYGTVLSDAEVATLYSGKM